ncbi:hypothetical protein Q5P01_022208 [Channa striata]|uniref:Uncharacterized protein n=1 Tax=Channa striata TaxID=64152 RepID=A0AA88IWQ8_CHASR|nr:hypothetical protein Q5P01_022208 [Channa striata]
MWSQVSVVSHSIAHLQPSFIPATPVLSKWHHLTPGGGKCQPSEQWFPVGLQTGYYKASDRLRQIRFTYILTTQQHFLITLQSLPSLLHTIARDIFPLLLCCCPLTS